MIKNIIIFILAILLIWTLVSFDGNSISTEITESKIISETLTAKETATTTEYVEEVLTTEEQAQEYCGEFNTVYISNKIIKVVSSIPGGGTSYYSFDKDQPIFNCPVIAPDLLSEECKDMLNKTDWIEACEE